MNLSPPAPPPVVLASASAVRARLLGAAGVAFATAVSHVDEDEMKRALKADGATAEDAAVALAEMKATRVARRHGGALVVGCDQILVCDGAWFDKPADLAGAREHLHRLSGKTHALATAAVAVRDGERIWHHVSAPKLAMRPLGKTFIDDYLARVGDAALASVGAYQLEGLGAQLFARIDGDYFTILGLPLLPLLDFLRAHKVVAS